MIMHDAATPITERIEYATEIQVALDFSETRRSLRAQPRQSYSYTLLERTRSDGLMWWRSLELDDQYYPWLPSAICADSVVPPELLPEYAVGSNVFVIGRSSVYFSLVVGIVGGKVVLSGSPAPTGSFLAPAVQGRAIVGDASYTGSLVRGATITVLRDTPQPIGAPMVWNTTQPDGATDITEVLAYREAQLDFTGTTLPYRDIYSRRPRFAHSYSYVFGRVSSVSKYRSFFMTKRGRLTGVDRARHWVHGMTIDSVEIISFGVYGFRITSLVRPAAFAVKRKNALTGVITEVTVVGDNVYDEGGFDWYVEWASVEIIDFLIDDCPYILTNRRIDQDVLEITHIAPGVATSTLAMVDL